MWLTLRYSNKWNVVDRHKHSLTSSSVDEAEASCFVLLIIVCGSDSWAISGGGSGSVVLVYREVKGWVDAWHNAGNHSDLLCGPCYSGS